MNIKARNALTLVVGVLVIIAAVSCVGVCSLVSRWV